MEQDELRKRLEMIEQKMVSRAEFDLTVAAISEMKDHHRQALRDVREDLRGMLQTHREQTTQAFMEVKSRQDHISQDLENEQQYVRGLVTKAAASVANNTLVLAGGIILWLIQSQCQPLDVDLSKTSGSSTPGYSESPGKRSKSTTSPSSKGPAPKSDKGI